VGAGKEALQAKEGVRGKTMKWFGIVRGFSRGDEDWKNKVTLELNTKDLLLASAVLLHAGFFNKEDALKDWKSYLGNVGTPDHDPGEDLFFLDELKDVILKRQGNNALAANGEEWVLGTGKTKELAQKMFDVANSALDDDSEWDESIEKAIDMIEAERGSI